MVNKLLSIIRLIISSDNISAIIVANFNGGTKGLLGQHDICELTHFNPQVNIAKLICSFRDKNIPNSFLFPFEELKY